jgi:hypothetical protein
VAVAVKGLAGAVLVTVVLAACMPVVVPIAEGPPEGPQLAIQIANASDREVKVGYEFEGPQMTGGGEGTVGSCEQVAMPFGPVSERYTILLDGEALHDAAAPAGVPAGAWVVVRISVDADGDANVTGSGIAPRMPDPNPRPIADCG